MAAVNQQSSTDLNIAEDSLQTLAMAVCLDLHAAAAAAA